MRIANIERIVSVLCIAISSYACLSPAQMPPGSSQPIFDFHSGFWINLHHFLYLEALSEKPQEGPYAARLSEADAAILHGLPPEERSLWNAAVSYYSDSVIQHDLLFDHNMNAIKNQLEDTEMSPDLAHVDIPDALRAALLKAAPVYRTYFWPRHDAQNRTWIAHVRRLIEKYGEPMRDCLVRIYETPWPGQPVRVDVTIFATQYGAYTATGPTRPTISTTNPANQGTAALEIVFHETSHAMIDKVQEAIRGAEADVNAHISNGAFHSGTLWHAALFYTAGELVAERIPGYAPYADKNGLWARAWHDPDRALIERDWKPHISGTVPLSAAIEKLVADVAAGSSQPEHAGTPPLPH
ncbi:MAG: hypothetical protein JOZ62_20060 [Acidobacteriaceae bacterium]|nr:hypothetical protein [Acidobacteriaceae bacterium]